MIGSETSHGRNAWTVALWPFASRYVCTRHEQDVACTGTEVRPSVRCACSLTCGHPNGMTSMASLLRWWKLSSTLINNRCTNRWLVFSGDFLFLMTVCSHHSFYERWRKFHLSVYEVLNRNNARLFVWQSAAASSYITHLSFSSKSKSG
jgi:hypothetical protein